VRIGLVYLKPRQVAFVSSHGPYETASQSAWKELFAWCSRNKLRANARFGYGLAQDHADVKASTGRYDACIELPEGFMSAKHDSLPMQTLPGGAFARSRHVGLDDVSSVIGSVRDSWLASQDTLVVDRRRPLLVVYLYNRQLQSHDILCCDVCIPVRTQHDDVYARTKFIDPPHI
jgi:AraC family transcriptional regulator